VLDDPAPALGGTITPDGDGIVAVVRAGGATFGLLCVHDAGHRRFDAADRTFLGTVADLLGAALDARRTAPPGRPASRTGTAG
jgi:hypothetical protein